MGAKSSQVDFKTEIAMEFYINDLSLQSSQPILTMWSDIVALSEYIDKVKSVITCVVRRPANIWQSNIGDYRLSTLKCNDGRKLSVDQEIFILTLVGKCPKGPSSNQSFTLKNDSWPGSYFVAYAAEKNIPLISIPVSPFTVKTINGFLGTDKKNCCTSFVKNFYGDGDDLLNRLPFDAAECIDKDALADPLWNQSYITALLDGITFTQFNPNEKDAAIIRLGTRIAVMNGWMERHDLNRLNSPRSKNTKKGALRHIFQSSGFATDAYISIDIEGHEVRFELYDKNGKHRGELHTNGVLDTSKKDSSHDIKI